MQAAGLKVLCDAILNHRCASAQVSTRCFARLLKRKLQRACTRLGLFEIILMSGMQAAEI